MAKTLSLVVWFISLDLVSTKSPSAPASKKLEDTFPYDPSLLFHRHEPIPSDYLLQFQSDGVLSNQTFASYSGDLKEMQEMTWCYWFYVHYHHSTMSLASYCAPNNNCSQTDEEPKCSNIQYHLENKNWEEFRVEFSISEVKTKSLKAKVVPKRWNHHCLTYESRTGKVTMFSSGQEQSHAILMDKSLSKHPVFPGQGILFLGQEQERLCGGFDDYDSLSADISEFQIWDKILPELTIAKLAHCESFEQGNVLSWENSSSKWSLANVTTRRQPNLRSEFCKSFESDMFLVVFPERRTVEMASSICQVHGGYLPVPINIHHNRQMATLGKTFEPVCSQEGKDNVNQPYMWLGIEDPQGSGIWRARINQEILGYTNWDKNEGSEGDTCARMQGNGYWRDTVCKKSVNHCVMCHISNPQQVFTLRGLCDESQFDRGYFLANGQVQDKDNTRMRPIYEGYFSHIHWRVTNKTHIRGSSGFWEISSRVQSDNDQPYWARTNATSQIGYPVGRHTWLIVDQKCDLFTPTLMNLTLSRCNEHEFTCNDGLCVPSEQRCDLVQNCEDFSDELGCDTVIIPSTYLQNPPTDPRHMDQPVHVSLRINILNIDKIDTVNMMFALTMEVNVEWRDHRLKYKNLREGLGQNQLSSEEIERIWQPSVAFTNAKIGQLEIKDLGIMVRREANPLPFSHRSPVEDKIYLGTENSLVISRKYYAEYGCTFDLRSFPFDDQQCTMNFTMESAKASYVALNITEHDITYQGEILLLEFFIKDIFAHGRPLLTESGRSMVSVFIQFHRELGNMVNTYFQTFLLCLMAYLTLYINLADFGNRFMGALTSLLVLASLLASIEENLPKTSYFKKIDVWFMSYIIFIFVIIVFHICVDFCTGQRDEMFDNTNLMVRQTKRSAIYLNNWGKVVFPIVLIVFTILYFVLSLI